MGKELCKFLMVDCENLTVYDIVLSGTRNVCLFSLSHLNKTFINIKKKNGAGFIGNGHN